MRNSIFILLFLCVLNVCAERIKEPLEYFDLAQLHLVEIDINSKSKAAFVISPDGKRNIIKVGNHLGENYGRVMEIDREFIKIKEIIKNPKTGEWKERDIFLKVKVN